MSTARNSKPLFADAVMPEVVNRYPLLRFMGSKYRLLPWIFETLSELEFDSALDGFSGSGCVSYLLKAMGKEVTANDFLRFCVTIAEATVMNSKTVLTPTDLDLILCHDDSHPNFIETTFSGIFFSQSDLRFLDLASWNIRKLRDAGKRSLALSALMRSAIKRQPRGVFTVAGDPEKHKDGRRDLKLSIEEHFVEQVPIYNRSTFDNGRKNKAVHGSIFDLERRDFDLVYLDPPYVPRADDNCYIKRYHFLEGLASYWQDAEIVAESRVKKLRKPFTPFSYRKTALEAFGRLFEQFEASIIVLSYSSNGFPDLTELTSLMQQYKKSVIVHSKDHRYHFGTHRNAVRNNVKEYLIIGK